MQLLQKTAIQLMVISDQHPSPYHVWNIFYRAYNWIKRKIVEKEIVLQMNRTWPGVIINENKFISDCYNVKDNNKSNYSRTKSQSRYCSPPDNAHVGADIDKMQAQILTIPYYIGRFHAQIQDHSAYQVLSI